MKRMAADRPRLYYGWIIVLALSITETISWGILYYSFSVFLKPMQQELGWSRGGLTGAGSGAGAETGELSVAGWVAGAVDSGFLPRFG